MFWLHEINKNHMEDVGHKALMLSEINALNIQVPKGFVISATTYDTFIIRNGIKDVLEEIEQSLDPQRVYQVVQHMFLNSKYNAQEIHQLRSYYNQLKKPLIMRLVHVRHDSVLDYSHSPDRYIRDIKTFEAFSEQIIHMWASNWETDAYGYVGPRLQRTANQAIIVQEEVKHEKLGTAFTIHPMTATKDQGMVKIKYALETEAPIPHSWTIDFKKQTYWPEREQLRFVFPSQANSSIKHPLIDELSVILSHMRQHDQKPKQIEFAVNKEGVFVTGVRELTAFFDLPNFDKDLEELPTLALCLHPDHASEKLLKPLARSLISHLVTGTLSSFIDDHIHVNRWVVETDGHLFLDISKFLPANPYEQKVLQRLEARSCDFFKAVNHFAPLGQGHENERRHVSYFSKKTALKWHLLALLMIRFKWKKNLKLREGDLIKQASLLKDLDHQEGPFEADQVSAIRELLATMGVLLIKDHIIGATDFKGTQKTRGKGGLSNRAYESPICEKIEGLTQELVSLFTQLGKNMHTQGLLEAPQDIMYLTLETLQSDTRRWKDLVTKAKIRHEGHTKVRRVPFVMDASHRMHTRQAVLNRENVPVAFSFLPKAILFDL